MDTTYTSNKICMKTTDEGADWLIYVFCRPWFVQLPLPMLSCQSIKCLCYEHDISVCL